MEPKRSKSNTSCSVFGCRTSAKSCKNVSFHHFPQPNPKKMFSCINNFGISEKIDIRKLWEVKLICSKPATKYMRVCSLHFTKEDYLPIGRGKGLKKILRRTAVPTLKLPNINRTAPKERNKNIGAPHLQIIECSNKEETRLVMDSPINIKSEIKTEEYDITYHPSSSLFYNNDIKFETVYIKSEDTYDAEENQMKTLEVAIKIEDVDENDAMNVADYTISDEKLLEQDKCANVVIKDED